MFINSCSSFIYNSCNVHNGNVHYVFCEQEKRRPASMQISLFISTRVHQWSGGTDGRTDTVIIGRSLSTGSNVLKFNSSKKHAMP